MQYKVTLAMPIYNVERFVEKALLSALNQSFDFIEYILVDDKGTDNSINIANEVIKQHPRGKDVRIIDHGINRGTGATKNTAIDNASGEFLYFMDSDDEITPDCISILYKAMMETPVDFVAASSHCTSLDGSIDEKRETRLYLRYKDILIKESGYIPSTAYYLNNIKIAIPTWNKLYNIDFLKRNNIKCIPHHLTEDNYFTYQIILRAESCRLLSDITYYYYENEKSTVMIHIINSCTPRMAKEYDETCSLERKYSLNYHNSIFYSKLIQQNYKYAVNCAIRIYKSKQILSTEKKTFISNILKYSIGLREIMNTNQKNYHIPNFIISKIPSVDFKIFLLKVMIKLGGL
jgi:glycosyltransferase involved in cell wall biosynthesis